ncbi:MAG: response regulator [bacterium]|nr:response regulator [bacterium]
MEFLKNFASKPFPDQINTLTQIGKEKDPRCLPELFSLYDRRTGDKTVDTMVEHTLRDTLAGNEGDAIKKIISGNAREKRLCLQIAGINTFLSAAPAIVELVKKEQDVEILTAAFIAMSKIKSPSFLKLFKDNIRHPDSIIAGISIQMLGEYKDITAVEELEKLIDDGEAEGKYETCSVSTAGAVEALAAVGNDPCIRFLAANIHHRNPTARRMIQEELVRTGERALPFLENVFISGDGDKKIMVATTIGRIGEKRGGDILLAALDKGMADLPNVRVAIYEAFGFIHSLKGLVFLVDALAEEDLQVLITVCSSLDLQVNPGMVDKIKEMIECSDAHGKLLVQAVVGARAVTIFEHLYPFGNIRERLIDTILKSNDAEILDAFSKKLETMPGEQAASDHQKISFQETEKGKLRILAVDDSRPMRLFYKSIIAKMNIETVVAKHGKDALEKLESGEPFDLIVTDLNMPVMDGLEFTRTVRTHLVFAKIPIIMGTTESDRSQKKMIRNSGVNDIITKPIHPKVLREKINSYLF